MLFNNTAQMLISNFVFTSRNKPLIVAEVKWGNFSKKDMDNFKEKAKAFPKARKIFIAKNHSRIIDKEIEIITPEDVLREVKIFYKNAK